MAHKAPKKNEKEVSIESEKVNASFSHESITPEIHGLPLTTLKEFDAPASNHYNSTEIASSSPGQFESRKQFDATEFNLNELSKIDDLDAKKTTFKPLDGSSKMDDTEFILIVILCILIPPLAVFLMYGISTEFWISLLLTLLFWLPGVIYALILAFDIY